MAQAYISKIDSRFVEKVGANMHDLVMSNGDTIGVGKFPPKGFSVGDYVQYEYTANGKYKNLVAGSLSKLDKPAGVAPPPAKGHSASSSNAQQFDARQTVISKQAALNSAMTWVAFLASQDAIPGITKSTKTDVKLDLLRSTLDQFTGDFYHQSTGEVMEFPVKKDLATDPLDLASLETHENWNEE